MTIDTEMTSANVPARLKRRAVIGKAKNMSDGKNSPPNKSKTPFMNAFKKKYGAKATSKAMDKGSKSPE
jgi:hypothetical protein